MSAPPRGLYNARWYFVMDRYCLDEQVSSLKAFCVITVPEVTPVLHLVGGHYYYFFNLRYYKF